MRINQGNSMSKMHKSNQPTPRRTSLQTIALIYVVIHGFLFWAIARSMAVEDTTLSLVLFGLSAVASVIAGIAMWYWKRWGIYLYAIATLVLGGVVLLKTMSLMMMFGAILPMFIVIYILYPAFKHFK
jgi:hypothetical protein